MTWLLDGNVLVALAMDSHIHHERVRLWFDTLSEPFATCAVTEGTLLRHLTTSPPPLLFTALAHSQPLHPNAIHALYV